MPRPQLLVGGASLGAGSFNTLEQLQSLIVILRSHNISRVDTAALYPSIDKGRSESLMGEAWATGHLKGIKIDTKILTTSVDGKNTLAESAILESVSSSHKRLSGNGSATNKINTLYCHVFDPVTPLSETTMTLASLHKAGDVFETLGVSNFSAPEVDSFVVSCEETSCPKPVVFQGLYNALSRNAERSLPHSPDVASVLSTIRKHGMSYIAWSPLAGGFLTGKLTRGEHLDTRLAGDGGKFHRMMYDKPAMHKAVKMLEEACSEEMDRVRSGREDIPPLAEASLRWLYWHSALNESDGMILGASVTDMIEANCKAIERGPLPKRLVQAFDEAWEIVKEDAPKF